MRRTERLGIVALFMKRDTQETRMAAKDVLVVIAPATRTPRKADLSAVTFGCQVAEQAGGACDILLLGADAVAGAEALRTLGVRTILTAHADALTDYTAEAYTAAAAAVIGSRTYRLIGAAASTTTKDYFPRLAAVLNAPMLSDAVETLAVTDDRATFLRAVFAGNLIAEAEIAGTPVLATCRASSFEPAGDGGSPVGVESVALPENLAHPRKRYLGLDATPLERPELTEAEIIVSGGRGTNGESGFKLVNALADVLGAAVGASRAAVDAGWMPNDFQVGQTGKIVAPKLYFAVGVSGAIQHLAGMRNSKTIVAINKDAEAPIFEVADFGLVADLFEALPVLTAALSAARQQ